MRTIYESFLLTLLEEAGRPLRGVARLLFEELFAPRRVVGTPWSHLTTAVADGRDCPLGCGLTVGTSRGGRVNGRFASTSVPIGLIWRDASLVVLRGDRIGRSRAEARNGIGHGFLLETVEVQIDVRGPVCRLVPVLLLPRRIYISHKRTRQWSESLFIQIRSHLLSLDIVSSNYPCAAVGEMSFL